jgi:hypothetical protein
MLHLLLDLNIHLILFHVFLLAYKNEEICT